MKIIIKKKKYIFEVDKPDIHEAYKEAAMLDMLPDVCDQCGSDDVYLTYRMPKGFKYPGIKCRACGADAAIQGKKDGSEWFIKKMERYSADNKTQREQPDSYDNSGNKEVPF